MQKSTYEFISRQTNDPIVERRTCRRTGKPFAIFQSDIDFLEKISPTFGGKKYQIPLPTLCPEERQRRRLMFRNERKLYKRKCGLCGKQVVSMFSPEKQQPVYCHNCRWQDTWDAQKYQQDYTFDQSFTEQYATLRQQVPEL